VRRYRDSYVSDRFSRDGSGAAVRRYHEEGVTRELNQSKSESGQATLKPEDGIKPTGHVNQANGSDRPNRDSGNPPSNGSNGWLRKFPFRR
jgi:hypothetical protein